MMIIAGKSPIGVAAPPRFDIASNNENRLIIKNRIQRARFFIKRFVEWKPKGELTL